jgi:long-chain fatty acid transport protein
MTNHRLFVLSLRTAALVFLAASPAYAGGFLTDQFGSDHGQPALANAYSVYFNPAAMAGMTGSNVTLDAVGAGRALTFNRSASALSSSCASSPTCVQANTGQASLFNLQGAPYLGFVTDFGGTNLRLGVAAYVPFGGTVMWDKAAGSATVPGAYDSTARWSGVNTTLATITTTAAFAYRFEHQHLGIGVNVSGMRSSLATTRAQALDSSDNTALEGRTYLDVSGFEVSAAAGLYWEPTSGLRLGASYISQPNFGTMKLSGTFEGFSPTNSIPSTKVDFYQAYPDMIRLGGAWAVTPKVEARLDMSYQLWSRFTNQCIVNQGNPCTLGANGSSPLPAVLLNLPRNFQNTFKARAGAAFWATPRTELFGSFAFETSAVPTKYIDPLIYDSSHLAFTLGARQGFTAHLYASLAATYTYFLPLTVTDSALATYAAPSKTPSENGTYSSAIYILDASVSYLF